MNLVEVMSCVVSPLSDPKESRFWTVIRDGCSVDPTLTIYPKDEEEERVEGNGELEQGKEEIEGLDQEKTYDSGRKVEKQWVEAEEEIQPLRLSFILRPVYNESVHFLHCSLRLCVSDFATGKPMKDTVSDDCHGEKRIPPLVSRSPRHQVHFIAPNTCFLVNSDLASDYSLA